MKCAVPCPHDLAGTPCQLEAFHVGNHSWPMVIDMESWLPICRVCGEKAARCPCPAFDAQGRSNVIAPHEPPPPDVVRRVYERNAETHWPAPVVAEEKTEKRSRWRWVPPRAIATQTLPSAPDRPWCPTHGWELDDDCTGCDGARRAYEQG